MAKAAIYILAAGAVIIAYATSDDEDKHKVAVAALAALAATTFAEKAMDEVCKAFGY